MALGNLLGGSFGAFVPFTITSLNSLATSAALLAGAASLALDVQAVLGGSPGADILVSGFIKGGTVPTVQKSIEVWVYGNLDDAPNYPSGIAGTDSAVTITTDQMKRGGLWLGRSILVDAATSNVVYPVLPFSLAGIMGGAFPLCKKIGLFVTHNCVAALNAAGHSLGYTAVDGSY